MSTAPNNPTTARKNDSSSDTTWYVPVLVILALLGGTALLLYNRKPEGNVILVDAPWKEAPAKESTTELVDFHHSPRQWNDKAPPLAVAPFDAERAKDLQEAWAHYLGVPVEYTNSLGMTFRLIPPGEFSMGSTAEEIEEVIPTIKKDDAHWLACLYSEAPKHRVIITHPIYLAVHEVTQKQYQQIMGNNPAWFAKTGKEKHYVEQVSEMNTDNHAVEGVTWLECIEFCNRLSDQEKYSRQYRLEPSSAVRIQGDGYRLPSESEWEMSCRAGTTTRYWTGDEEPEKGNSGWFSSSFGGRSHAVGERDPNPYGLFDINSNVWEWTEDRFEKEYFSRIAAEPAVDPRGAAAPATMRVVRGGLWPNSYTRSTDRYAYEPNFQTFFVGFRIALPVSAIERQVQ